MTPLPNELRQAYTASAYVVTDAPTPMVLQVGVPNQAAAELLQAHGLKSAVFITAHNPWGNSLSATENQARHQQLLADLSPHWPLYHGFGVTPQGNWPAETSVLVLCDDPALHAHWMGVYQQNAVVVVSAGGTVLLENLNDVRN
jgi:hypothetical protein